MKVEITNWQVLEALSNNDLDFADLASFLIRIIGKLPDFSEQKATTQEAQNLQAEMRFAMTAILQKFDFETAKSTMEWMEALMKSKDYLEYCRLNNIDAIKF